MGFVLRPAFCLVQGSVNNGMAIPDNSSGGLSRLGVSYPDGPVSSGCGSQVFKLTGEYLLIVESVVQVIDDLVLVSRPL